MSRSMTDEARAFLASVEADSGLQIWLEDEIGRLLAQDSRARAARLGIALLDLRTGQPPRLAHHNGDAGFYPASVVKFVYLLAAYAWAEQGRLQIDDALASRLDAMIRAGSNPATQGVVRTLTGTEPGPELEPVAYAAFRGRRLAVKRWLQGLGVTGIHSLHPTYDGGGDLYGRDRQLMRDASLSVGVTDGDLVSRNAMSALDTAKLLALLATGRGLSPRTAAEVCGRMRRDPRTLPEQARRIAGGTLNIPGVEVYSQAGRWGTIIADAGIIRSPRARQLTLAIFVESTPAYDGTFIADLARACTTTRAGVQGACLTITPAQR